MKLMNPMKLPIFSCLLLSCIFSPAQETTRGPLAPATLEVQQIPINEAQSGSPLTTGPRLLDRIPDGTPPPPSPPKPPFVVPSKNVRDSTVYQEGGRNITISRIDPVDLPPPPIPAEPPTAEERAAWDTMRAKFAAMHKRETFLFLGATIYLSDNQPPRTFVRLWPTGGGNPLAFWSNADFRLIAGLYRFAASDGTPHMLMMAWSPILTERMKTLAGSKGKTWKAPEFPEFPNEQPGNSLDDTTPPGPATYVLADSKSLGEIDAKYTNAIRELHLLYNQERPRLHAAWQGRERARIAREAELKANPPKPKDIVIHHFDLGESRPVPPVPQPAAPATQRSIRQPRSRRKRYVRQNHLVSGRSRSWLLSISLAVSSLAVVPVAMSMIDENNNQISDIYERAWNNGQLFSSSHTPESDLDGDGWNLAKEAGAGTNPLPSGTAISYLQAHIEHVPPVYGDLDEDGIDEIISPETQLITWPTVSGKAYQLQVSPSMAAGSWLPLGEARIGIGTDMGKGVPITQGNGETPDRMFFRVAVTDIDEDGDDLESAEEALLGTNPRIADTNDDGIMDGAAYTMELSPTGASRDFDGNGTPDNHYYSVEFEFEYETRARLAPAPFPYTDRVDLNSRYFTQKQGTDYSISDSPRYASIANGSQHTKSTLMADGQLLLDSALVLSEHGQDFGDWTINHPISLGEREYIVWGDCETVVSDPVTNTTDQSTHWSEATTYTTPWTVKRDEDGNDDPVVRSGNEVIVKTVWSLLEDLMHYRDFWNDYVKQTPWQASVKKWGPLEQVDQLIASAGYEDAFEIVRDYYVHGSFPILGTISSPDVYWGGLGRDERIKSIRWRWVRFNPVDPFTYDATPPPASHMTTFRLPVTRRDRLGSITAGNVQNSVENLGIMEIVCSGEVGGGWHEVPSATFSDHRDDNPEYLDEIGFSEKLGDTKVTFQNFPSEVISRDRMLVGRLTVPEGCEDGFGIRFVNTTTGEDLGTYEKFWDPQYAPRFETSAERLFDESEQQAWNDGTLDPRIRSQKVIFCGTRSPGAPIEFYTVFAALGDVEIQILNHGSVAGVLRKTLVADPVFGGLIQYINTMVAQSPTATDPPDEGGGVLPLASRALVPLFNEAGVWLFSQPEAEVLLRGFLDGITAGVLDDWKIIQWANSNILLLQQVVPALLVYEVQRWISDPYARASDAANVIRNVVQNVLIEPLKGAGEQLGEFAGNFTSWERFKDFNWRCHQNLQAGEMVAVALFTNATGIILEALSDWYVGFCEDMYAGAELTLYSSIPRADLYSWRTDLRAYYRGAGFSFGYLGEQLLLGHGVAALSKGLAKIGPKILLTTLPTVKCLGVRVLPFLNRSWEARSITSAEREAAELAVRATQGNRLDARVVLDTDGARPVSELLNEAISRQPGTYNGKHLIEELENSPKIRQTILQEATRTHFLDRLAVLEKLIGSRLDDVVAKNFTRVYENKLLLDPATGKDIFEDFLVAIHTQFLSGQRPILDQLAGNAASLYRLEVFLKGPPPFSPWKAGFETADAFGDSARGLLIQLHEAVHGKYHGWTNLDILQDGKVVRATGVDLVSSTDPGHYVQITTTAASSPDWITKLSNSALAAKQRGGTKLTFDVFWLENNGRPTTSLQALENAKPGIADQIGIEIEILDTASKFAHWGF